MFDIESNVLTIYSSFTRTFKRISFHYSLWGKSSAMYVNDVSISSIVKLIYISDVHYKMFTEGYGMLIISRSDTATDKNAFTVLSTSDNYCYCQIYLKFFLENICLFYVYLW